MVRSKLVWLSLICPVLFVTACAYDETRQDQREPTKVTVADSQTNQLMALSVEYYASRTDSQQYADLVHDLVDSGKIDLNEARATKGASLMDLPELQPLISELNAELETQSDGFQLTASLQLNMATLFVVVAAFGLDVYHFMAAEAQVKETSRLGATSALEDYIAIPDAGR